VEVIQSPDCSSTLTLTANAALKTVDPNNIAAPSAAAEPVGTFYLPAQEY